MEIIETGLKFTRRPSVRRRTNLIVIHHTASRDVSAQVIHSAHLRNGWIGNGYHFLIRADGQIERGRPENSVGAHVNGFNSNSIGIGLLGNFMTRLPSQTQIESLEELVIFLTEKYPNVTRICSHKDLDATLCPGTIFYNWLQNQEWYDG